MELTGKLKENVEKAENKEDAKKIIKEAGMILSDTELDQIAGGGGGIMQPISPKKGLPFQ